MEVMIVLLILSVSNFLLWGGMLISFIRHNEQDEDIENLIKKHKHLRNEVNENMCHIYEQKKDQQELREMYTSLNSRMNEEKLKGIYKNEKIYSRRN